MLEHRVAEVARCDRVQVDNCIEALRVRNILHVHPVLDGPKVVTKVNVTRWLNARNDGGCRLCRWDRGAKSRERSRVE